MKSIISFYILIFVPISTIVLLAASRLIGNNVFASLLLIYALIYHPFISAQRLIAAGKIS